MKFIKKVISFVISKFGYVVLKTPQVARMREDSFPKAYLDLLAQSPFTSSIKVSEAQEIISNAKSQIGQDILALCANGLKRNGFFVESGKMIIRVWKNNYDLVDETVLTEGQYTKVAPGEYHQFEAVEDCVAFELYWAEFDHDDIERDTVGYSK